jgi:hypothetical protein
MSIKNSIKDGTGSNLEAKVNHTSVTKEESLWVNIAGVSPNVTIPVVIGGISGGFEIDQKLLNGASNQMAVDGSTTPAEFRLEADPDFDLLVIRIALSALDGSVKIDKWFSANTALSNGCVLSLKQNNITVIFDTFLNSGDVMEFATEGGAQLENVSASVYVKGSHKLESPYIIRAQGTHGLNSDDYISMLIKDDLTFMESFRCIITTIKVPTGVF